jgi:protein-tyrosine sulfotransferase
VSWNPEQAVQTGKGRVGKPLSLPQRLRRTSREMYRAAYVARWRKRSHVSDASPIIIGGCPRSGTTLMRVILDTHPGICCGPETALFKPLWPNVRKLPNRFGIPPRTLEALFNYSPSQAWFIDELFKLYCRLQNKPRWAEKTPTNVLYLDFVFEHFPSARFVHVLRDGRDTVCSLRTHPRHKIVNGEIVKLNTRHPLRPCVERWHHDVREGLRFRGDPRYTEVRYEDVVNNPRPTLEKLFAFLGEPFDERVLSFHSVTGRSRDVTNFLQNPEATQPLYTKSISRWRSDFSPEDIATFKEVGGPLLMDLGYAGDLDW